MSTTVESKNSSRFVDFDEYVDFQLEKTRQGIRWTDMVTAAAVIAAFAVGYLLIFTLLDHWLIPGGFGRTARFEMVAVLVLLSTGWLIWKIALPFFKKVSSLYAAQAIEQTEPGLKSTLLTLVDLRRSGREMSGEIRGALEKRAAKTLATMDVEQALDRRPLMRAAYVLLALVVLTCLYSVLSPKRISPLRAFLPPANVAPATRTKILDVHTDPPFSRPGEVDVIARTQLEVLVDLSGEVPERVTLRYTTADRKFKDLPVVMRPVEKGLKQYRGILNGENGSGILQSLTFHIEAGDAVSSDYQVFVSQPPSADVDLIHYQYPKYMELENKDQPDGNIDAWEGTKVTLTATVNMPVKSAVLQFFDGEDTSTKAEELRMKVSAGNKLRADWTLKFRTDGTYPRSYRIYCINDEGQADPEPALYTQTIRPDRRPVVELLDPRGDLEVPANAIIPLLIEAHDPDFQLTYITLRREKNGEVLPLSPEIFKGLQQKFRTTWEWHLKPMNLKAGDVITYWVEARDNKEPLGNLSEKRQLLELHIVDRVPEEEADRKLKADRERIRERLEDAKQDENEEGQPDAQPQEDGEEGNEGDKEQKDQEGTSKDSPKPGEGDPKNKPDGNNDDKGKTAEKPKDGQEGTGQPDPQGDGKPEDGKQPLDPTGKDDTEALRQLLKDHQRQQDKEKKQNEDGKKKEQDTDKPNADGKKPGESPDQKPHKPGEQPKPDEGDPKPEGAQNDSTQKKDPDGSDKQKNGEKPKDGKNPDAEKKPDGAGTEGGNDDKDGGEDKGDSKGKPSDGKNTDGKTKPGDVGDNSKPGSKGGDKSDKQLDGPEKPADATDDARRKKAIGDEEGPAEAEKDPDAKSTTAKNKLERKPGEEPMKRPGEGDPKGAPQKRKSDSSGSKNPNQAAPAKRTKKGDQKNNNPDTRPSTPKENDPNKKPAQQDEQPDSGNNEQKGKGSDNQPTPKKSEGGNAGKGKPNDQGDKGGNKPGAGDSSKQPGKQEQSDKPKKGESGDERGDGSKKTDGDSKDGGSKKSGKPSKDGGKGKGDGKSSQDKSESKDGKPGGSSGKSSPSDGPTGGDGKGGGAEQGAGTGGKPADIEAAEKANLDYNKQAADLVLKQLQDKLDDDKVDQKLLDKFGWTKEELQKYLQRMNRVLNKPKAEKSPATDSKQQQIEEFLKGFNLRRGSSDRDRSGGGVAPRRREVPAEFREAYNAYRRSLSKKAAKRSKSK